MRPRAGLCPAVVLTLLLLSGCESEPAQDTEPDARDTLVATALPPEPMVTFAGPTEEHTPIQHRRLPGRFDPPAMTAIEDFALLKDDLVVINPGPGEYVQVMEGQRHGYRNLTVGITYTAPGGAPPMHTHEGEEAHVLLEGKILYALGDDVFTIEGPYSVNIPPMVPHSFMNLGEGLAELVVIFPTNV